MRERAVCVPGPEVNIWAEVSRLQWLYLVCCTVPASWFYLYSFIIFHANLLFIDFNLNLWNAHPANITINNAITLLFIIVFLYLMYCSIWTMPITQIKFTILQQTRQTTNIQHFFVCFFGELEIELNQKSGITW